MSWRANATGMVLTTADVSAAPEPTLAPAPAVGTEATREEGEAKALELLREVRNVRTYLRLRRWNVASLPWALIVAFGGLSRAGALRHPTGFDAAWALEHAKRVHLAREGLKLQRALALDQAVEVERQG